MVPIPPDPHIHIDRSILPRSHMVLLHAVQPSLFPVPVPLGDSTNSHHILGHIHNLHSGTLGYLDSNPALPWRRVLLDAYLLYPYGSDS